MSNYILHIETATKVCSVALSENGKEISKKEIASDQYIHGESITIFITNVLAEAKIQMTDLSAVSVSSGPGSYTGLRIGASTVKGICYALDIPLIVVPTLESLQALAKINYPNSAHCIMLDARRMEVYSQIWSTNNEIVKPLSADVLNETSYLDFMPFVCIGDGCDKMKELWKENSVEFNSALLPSASGQIEIAYNKFLRKDFTDVAKFVPDYLKEFQSTGH